MATHLSLLALFGNAILLRFNFAQAKHESCHRATLPATHLCVLSQSKELMGVRLSCPECLSSMHKALSSMPSTAETHLEFQHLGGGNRRIRSLRSCLCVYGWCVASLGYIR